MPKLVHLYIKHTIIGFIISAVFVVGLFYFNIANLWHLVTHTQGGWLAAFVLFMLNGIVFSGVQFGIAIMNMKEDDTPKRGTPIMPRELQPVMVKAAAQKKRL
ncbi:hypothetical protein [Parasulfitobacter algicola]|uniref:Uncharacterized protein n=1 Tax=Parasulfitobacter algicola TaxID=2614809 RepID=A0ABX2IM98_9RHOB|nr:hypothetical protein [Sulfitobacter algicola]NSX54016.1 hypothetical protein [Sulfitobacter algicola]